MGIIARAYGRILLVAVVLLVVAAAVGGAEELTPELLYQQASPSVVRLEVETPGGETVVGNAFMAVRDGVAVTACHLLRGAQRVTAVFPGGESFEVSGLIDRDEARNVALVRVKVVDRPLLSLNTAEPPVGSRVYVIGPPEGLDFGFADGMLAQAQTVDGVRTYQFTASSPLARSGGPLLDPSGSVVGVVAVRVKDGVRLNFAVPTVYAAGLDDSLPTQPWGDVQWEGAAETSAPSAAQDATDDQLTEALVTAFDLVVAIRYADNATNGTGFQQGVPKLLYTHQRQAESQLRALSQVKSKDPQRQRLTQEAVQLLADGLKAADLFINAIVIAQSSTWGPQSKDLWSRCQAIVQSMERDRTSLYTAVKDVCQASPEFCQQLPIQLQYGFSLREREAGYALGVYSFARDPFCFVLVNEDSVGYKLGMRSGDRILTLGDRAFGPTDSIEDLKLLLKERPGENITLTIVRDGEEKTVVWKVPK